MAAAEGSLGPFPLLLLFLSGKHFFAWPHSTFGAERSRKEEKAGKYSFKKHVFPRNESNSKQYLFPVSSSLCTFSSRKDPKQSRTTTASLQWQFHPGKDSN